MVTKEDLIVTMFSTFCLTATLFMMMPTNSSLNMREYDPWLDYNDDGVINMRDIGDTCNAFGSTGDPTKTIRYDYYTEFKYFENVEVGQSVGFANHSTGGYRYFTLFIYAYDADFLVEEVSVSINQAYIGIIDSSFIVQKEIKFHMVYDIIGTGIHVWLKNVDTTPSDLSIVIYVTA